MTLQSILERCGIECRNYSGRGMYGKQCLAFSTGESLTSVFGEILCNDLDKEELRILGQHFSDAETDSLGRGVVVYFRSVEYIPCLSNINNYEMSEDEDEVV